MRSHEYDPPRPWDDPRYHDRHRGRGPISMVRGDPIDVEFLGWRSNTAELQRHGWMVAESKRHSYDSYDRNEWHIQIMHPEYRASGMSQPIRRAQRGYDREHRPFHLHMDIGLPFQTVQMQQMEYFPVDATPQHQVIHRPHDLYMMPYFQPLDQGKDVFLAKASVDEIMQIALDKQMPEQAEIRARRRQEQKREDYRRGGEVAGRIILVA